MAFAKPIIVSLWKNLKKREGERIKPFYYGLNHQLSQSCDSLFFKHAWWSEIVTRMNTMGKMLFNDIRKSITKFSAKILRNVRAVFLLLQMSQLG